MDTALTVVADKDGNITYLRQELFRNMLGYTAPELKGKNVWKILHKDDVPDPDEIADLLSDEAPTFRQRCRMRHQNGGFVRVVFDGRQRRIGNEVMLIMRWYAEDDVADEEDE